MLFKGLRKIRRGTSDKSENCKKILEKMIGCSINNSFGLIPGFKLERIVEHTNTNTDRPLKSWKFDV
jgi:hypothetical protein